MDDIVRNYDSFVQDQLVDKQATFGEADAKTTPMTEVERIINVTENNISTAVDSFFDAWQELATNPSGEVERQVVIP